MVKNRGPIFGAGLFFCIIIAGGLPSTGACAGPDINHGKPDLRFICVYDLQLCKDYQSLRDELDALAYPENQLATADGVRFLQDQLLYLTQRADIVIKRQPLTGQPYFEATLTLKARIDAVGLTALPAEADALSAALSDIEARMSLLEQDAGRAGGNLRGRGAELRTRLLAIDSEAARAWNRIRNISETTSKLGIATLFLFEGKSRCVGRGKNSVCDNSTLAPDYSSAYPFNVYPLNSDFYLNTPIDLKNPVSPSGKIALVLNGLHLRAAQLSHRAQRMAGLLEIARPVLGADWMSEQKRRIEPLFLLGNPAIDWSAKNSLILSPAVPAYPQQQSLLGFPRRHDIVRQAARPPAGAFQWKDLDAYPKETRRIRDIRRKGLTRTVGDPSGRAKYVFGQKGNTCGIAVQVELLEEAGIVEPGQENARKAEDFLYERAVQRGYFAGNAADADRRNQGGTPSQFAGDLTDLPVHKHAAASDAELAAAVKRGKMAILMVNMALLQNDSAFAGGYHFIAVTGAEVERHNGKVLGYYINDTSNETGIGGRFITTKQLLRAWHYSNREFTELL